MLLSLSREPERPLDIARAWIKWFADLGRGSRFSTAILTAVLGGLGAAMIWIRGPLALAVFAVLLVGALFMIGPLGEAYQSARVAWRWQQEAPEGLSPSVFEIPSRRYLLLTTVAAASFSALGILGCWPILGYGWDTLPVVEQFSPWTVLLIPVACLILSEAVVARRVRAEFRDQWGTELDALFNGGQGRDEKSTPESS